MSETKQGPKWPVPYTRIWEDSSIAASLAHPVLITLVLHSYAYSTPLKPQDMLPREH